MPSFENVTDEQIEEFTEYIGKKLDLIVEAFRVYDLSRMSKKKMSLKEKWDESLKLVDETTELAKIMNVPEEKRYEFCKKHIENEKVYVPSEFSRNTCHMTSLYN